MTLEGERLTMQLRPRARTFSSMGQASTAEGSPLGSLTSTPTQAAAGAGRPRCYSALEPRLMLAGDRDREEQVVAGGAIASRPRTSSASFVSFADAGASCTVGPTFTPKPRRISLILPSGSVIASPAAAAGSPTHAPAIFRRVVVAPSPPASGAAPAAVVVPSTVAPPSARDATASPMATYLIPTVIGSPVAAPLLSPVARHVAPASPMWTTIQKPPKRNARAKEAANGASHPAAADELSFMLPPAEAEMESPATIGPGVPTAPSGPVRKTEKPVFWASQLPNHASAPQVASLDLWDPYCEQKSFRHGHTSNDKHGWSVKGRREREYQVDKRRLQSEQSRARQAAVVPGNDDDDGFD